MSEQYKLSYQAEEIDEKLGNIDSLMQLVTITGLRWHHISGRPTDLNFNLSEFYESSKSATIISCLSTSSCTTGRCPSDGIVLTFVWDNPIYGCQVCFVTGGSTGIYKRQYNNSTWGEWYQV